MKRTLRILLYALSASLAAFGVASEARAQGSLPQTVVARGLYEQAVAAIGRKDYEAAYPMLEEAIRLEPLALGARLALAECYEAADKLASAWGMYGIVEQEAVKAKQEDRQIKAHERAAALKPRLANLVIEVPDAVSRLPGLAIKRDGVPVGPAQWGVPLPADKGSHLLVIDALGRQSAVITFEVLADGITARAVLPEPPPPSRGVPWWDAAQSPQALPRVDRPLPTLRPPPPAPEVGVPMISLAGPSELELREATPSGGARICSAPCGVTVDARARQEFRLGGEGILDSERFRLDGRIGKVVIRASPASSGTRVFSIFAMSFGSAATLGCGIGLPVSARAGGAAPVLVGVCLGGGLLSLAIGVPLFVSTKTTYTISSSDDQAGGINAFHF